MFKSKYKAGDIVYIKHILGYYEISCQRLAKKSRKCIIVRYVDYNQGYYVRFFDDAKREPYFVATRNLSSNNPFLLDI